MNGRRFIGWSRPSAWASLAGVLALLCQLAAAFHHHPDLAQHDDCQVCVAAHQVSSPPADPISVVVVSSSEAEFLLPLPEAVHAPVPFRAHAPRGPPSLA